ncbi:APC family permease [Acidihalobacter ferrooxydans]|nr:APC family permease [Acidihalobacter ferrooxydans]
MTQLRRNLGLIEAVGLSLSIVAPTMAMAFNVTLAAGAAGTAAPLAFAVGTLAMAVVGLSFVAFARRVSHVGSAYAYITKAFGPRAGFVTGWALMLTYLAYGTGTAALVGNFFGAALENYHVLIPHLWLTAGVATVMLAMWLAYRDMQLAARLMLGLEIVSVCAILVLGVLVLHGVSASGGLSMAPFKPDAHFGWSGIGHAMVFAVLSFAGFEGAATLGEETGNPNRAIPLAVLGTVVLAGLFYVFASYVQVVGYGLGDMQALANASAPLNTLALKFASRDFATILDLAAGISAFACALGSLSAASRMLFALGRIGLAPAVCKAHPRYGTPGAAVLTMGALMIAGLVLWAPAVGAGDYYGDVGTIGTLALILVYMGVASAEAVEAVRTSRFMWALFGALGAAILLWPLYGSVYPVPVFPGNLWPYVVVAYLVLGVALILVRPAIGRAALAELQPR